MRFRKLVEYLEELERTASRLEMTRILAEVFRQASEEEIDKICYLSLGRLVPLYESLEFNLAEKMVMRAMAEAFEVDIRTVVREFKREGDLGKVAEKLRSKGAGKNLAVLAVYDRLRQIAEDGGQGSQERKVSEVMELLRQVEAVSGKYIVKMILGKLRLGFSDKTMIDALSWMVKGNKSLRGELEAAYFVRADIGALAKVVKKYGKVKSLEPELGVPVMPALCQRLKSAKEMIAKMGKVAVEPKFDGTRVAMHIRGKEFLKTFTRNLEESTAMFPELKEAYRQVRAREVILDSEAVGIDPKSGRLLSFQDTIVRKRKHGVEETSRRVPLRFFVFDVLYKDGQSLLELPLSERRKMLKAVLGKGRALQLTEQVVTDNADELRKYHSQQLKKGLEGVVVKKWAGRYAPGRREFNWVKFKEEEKAAGGLADTLDCVVMGYYRGRGKRAKFGMGAFLVGIREGENFLTIAKIGTGLTDEQWKELKIKTEELKIKSQPKEYGVHKNLIPDVWVIPAMVVEIAADNITRSPNHSAGMALRFPRLVQFRDDKNPDQVTTVAEVLRL